MFPQVINRVFPNFFQRVAMPSPHESATENAEAGTPMSAVSRTSTHLLPTAAANRSSEAGHGALRPESDVPWRLRKVQSDRATIIVCNALSTNTRCSQHRGSIWRITTTDGYLSTCVEVFSCSDLGLTLTPNSNNN